MKQFPSKSPEIRAKAMLSKTPSNLSKIPTLPTSLKWRTELQQSHLISQVSSLLLHHKHWITILRNRNLISKLTLPIFLKILHNTQNNPQISLHFFNWSKTNLPFKPDLKSHLKIIQILVQSNLQEPARSILKEPIIQSEPISTVVNSSVKICKNGSVRSLVLSFLLENYPNCNLGIERLEMFRRIRSYGCVPTVNSCNALLDTFERSGDLHLVWCFFAAVIRSGVLPNSVMWVLLTRVFCREGKLKMAVKLLNSGFSSAGMYNLVIDGYCRNGYFPTALDLLNEMCCKKLMPGFGTYSSILDGACKFGDVGVMDLIMREMVVKGFLLMMDNGDYDLVIQKFCDLGKTYAAEMFFERARSEKIGLRDSSYLCMLKSFSKEGRSNDAMRVYRMTQEKGIVMGDDCGNAFANVICKEEPLEEVNMILKDVIRRGFLPLDLSKYVDVLCSKGQWQEADDLLSVVFEMGLLPEGFCCQSLVKRHCADGRIDSALALHYKMDRLGGCLDLISYNALLHGLCVDKRIEEAAQVFDCMRRRNVLSSTSFSTMIIALCHEKEMRKAMKMHDEMLQKGLKPDEVTYKRLILEFKTLSMQLENLGQKSARSISEQGAGMISIPYALSKGGWLSLILILLVEIICCYTGLLL
ncbi:pentatricopeptide repeat-containing protein At4g21170 [Magnolia sinica]|uniref:pentatricopeptide repeat-containing protein At4g21170 n=1 Tax=Magnolia sinica TaxID=86752 RepID=UPI002657EFE2|nr:pentatricopeptide repeat-containing protein At4g21170 [Magnolia sinica]XP_058072653.1 pentatricopeptide repeat-containing protein At4g21170 [Magnolia sinica]